MRETPLPSSQYQDQVGFDFGRIKNVNTRGKKRHHEKDQRRIAEKK